MDILIVLVHFLLISYKELILVKNTLISLGFFGGEKTYQSWNGLEDLDKLKNDRTFNVRYLYRRIWEPRFYDNETDNYQQDHYQLHWVKS
jgi:iron complex outermembrane receptor protein